MNTFIATKNDSGRTLLKFVLSIFKDVSKNRIEKLFRNKDIKVNGKRVKDKKIILNTNDEIIIYGLDLKEFSYSKNEITFKTIYEDDNILIISKPEGLVVHEEKESLDNQVLTYLKFEKVDSFIPSHIGRLDKCTSGIMIYAKNYMSLRMLLDNQHKFEKQYSLISNLKTDTILKEKIFHDEADMKEKISLKFGKECETHFMVQKNNIVFAKLITGRKHQIRASLEHLKSPIKGDIKYGSSHAGRVYLHARKIIFKGLDGELSYLNNKEFLNKASFE